MVIEPTGRHAAMFKACRVWLAHKAHELLEIPLRENTFLAAIKIGRDDNHPDGLEIDSGHRPGSDRAQRTRHAFRLPIECL